MIRDEQAILTNAPVFLNMKDENGKEVCYKFRALNDVQISELDEWIRARALNVIYRSLEGIKDAALRKEILAAGNASIHYLSWMSEEGRQHVASIDGMAKLVQLSISEDHPDVEYKALRKLMTLPGNMKKARDASAYAAGVDPDATVKKKSRKATRRQQQVKKKKAKKR